MAHDASAPTAIVHGTCVAVAGRAVLIIGASGSGKSALALKMMGYGADLVADDRTVLTRVDDVVIASAPPTIAGLIEARGVGLLRSEVSGPHPVVLLVDMDRVEGDRLPQPHWREMLDLRLQTLHKVETDHFPAALVQYLKCGRRDPE